MTSSEGGRQSDAAPYASTKTSGIETTKPAFWFPLALLIFGALILNFTDFDLWFSSLFFDEHHGKWLGRGNGFCNFIDNSGKYCFLVPTGLCLLFLWAGWKNRSQYASLKHAGIYLLISLMLCNIVVNVFMKGLLDRPRPRHVKEFGGVEAFRPVLQPGFSGEGNSLPSSHAAAGFSLLTLYFALRRRWGFLAYACAISGVLLGALIGMNRICKGAHFVSDILWAFGVMYFTSYLIYHWLYAKRAKSP